MSNTNARLSLLGAFGLECDGAPAHVPHAAQRLLALLALTDRPIHRAHVAAMLWPESTVDKASGSLRSVLWRLKRVAATDLVVAVEEALHLVPGVDLDLREARALGERLITGREGPHDQRRAAVLANDLLPAWDEEWLVLERERFRQLRLHALEALSEHLADRERYGEAVGAAMEAVAGDPLRESAHRALITAYLAEDNRAEAVHQYRQCRQIFSDRLGLEPSDRLTDLITQALSPP